MSTLLVMLIAFVVGGIVIDIMARLDGERVPWMDAYYLTREWIQTKRSGAYDGNE